VLHHEVMESTLNLYFSAKQAKSQLFFWFTAIAFIRFPGPPPPRVLLASPY
jgi:hypothetical protein